MAAKDTPRGLLDKASPDTRRRLIMFLVGGGLFAVLVATVMINDDTGSRSKMTTDSRSEQVGNVLMTTKGREIGLAGVSRDVDSLEARLYALEQENRKLQQSLANAQLAAAQPVPLDPDQGLRALRDDALREQNAIAPPQGTVFSTERPVIGNPIIPPDQNIIRPERARQTPPVSPGSADGPDAPIAPSLAPQIHTIRAATPDAPAATRPSAAPHRVYLPTGAFMTGVLLNGLDAPTGRSAQNAPLPVLIRVKHEAILPSRYRSDVREAFVLASGFGDLSSERAFLRAERFSMILRNGDIIDIPIKMAAVGDDGKTGLRGRLVSKQGAVIGKALLAGTADGVSRAFSGSRSSFGSTDGIDGADIALGGVSGGTSSALDRIAAYFLAQADAMHPVIEVDGGRAITFILLEGLELTTRAAPAPVPAATPAVAADPRTAAQR